jgi:Holliday junction resolvase
MRRAAKVDHNHADVVQALRSAGASVQSLAAIGKGCPDLLVGYRGMWLLFEVKDGTKSPSRRKLTPDQEEWIKASKGGAVWLITSIPDALDALDKST